MGDIFKKNGVKDKTLPSGNSTNEELDMREINEAYDNSPSDHLDQAPDEGAEL